MRRMLLLQVENVDDFSLQKTVWVCILALIWQLLCQSGSMDVVSSSVLFPYHSHYKQEINSVDCSRWNSGQSSALPLHRSFPNSDAFSRTFGMPNNFRRSVCDSARTLLGCFSTQLISFLALCNDNDMKQKKACLRFGRKSEDVGNPVNQVLGGVVKS